MLALDSKSRTLQSCKKKSQPREIIPVEISEDNVELCLNPPRGLGGQTVPLLAEKLRSLPLLILLLAPGEDELCRLELVGPS